VGNLLLPQVVQHTDRRRVTPGERVKVNDEHTVLTPSLAVVDRPGWIPPEITDGWSPNPYACQTEAELARLRALLERGR